jgi:septal ring factor EnvC (AmiA/AmiB activator)
MLLPGKKLIAATFYRLEAGELGDFPKPAAPFDDFPEDLVAMIEKYQPVAVTALRDALRSLQEDVQAIRNSIDAHVQWRQQFERDLQATRDLIERVAKNLEKEVEARTAGQAELDVKFQKIEITLAKLAGAATVLKWFLGIASGVGIVIVGRYALKLLGWI